ncbi:MAG: hypothetical protein JXL80_05760 [Planctomycetes bacterium]|nr:hypothetical protein [Planctomycetota bacterium]
MGVVDDIVTLAKHAYDVAGRIKNAEIQGTIADLMLKISDLKLELVDLREENLNLRHEKDQLQARKDIRTKLVLRDRAYYLTEPIGGYSEGPFCPRCMDAEGVLITLTVYRHQDGSTPMVCPKCDCRL